MDNCVAHVTDDVIHLLIEAKVCVVTIAPRATQICQVLDVTLFSVLNRRPSSELPFKNDHATDKLIMKVYHDFRKTMVPPNV
jgi:hypothetical protein